jgi:hypothetical protein
MERRTQPQILALLKQKLTCEEIAALAAQSYELV